MILIPSYVCDWECDVGMISYNVCEHLGDYHINFQKTHEVAFAYRTGNLHVRGIVH